MDYEILDKKILTQYVSYVTTLSSKIKGEITFDVYILENKTKKIIYITSISAGTDKYFIERIWCDDMTITKIKRIYLWELRKFINGQDTVLLNIHKLFTRFFDDGLLVPYRVGQVVDIDNNNGKIEVNRNYLKRIRKYSFEITNDPVALKFFYEKMHVPHVKKKYGDSANIENFNILEKFLKNGELMFIKLNGENIAGELYEINGDVCYMRKKGVLDDSHVKDGALLAAYYFPILRAKEKNLKMVDLGGSKPFLLDGVLRHKNTWGARIFIDKMSKRVIYLKNILFEQPFIYIDNKKLKVDIFSENDKLIKEYAGSGLEFNIISKGDN